MNQKELQEELAKLPLRIRKAIEAGADPEFVEEEMRRTVAEEDAPPRRGDLAPVAKFAHFGCSNDDLAAFARMVHALPVHDQYALTTCGACGGPMGLLPCAKYVALLSTAPEAVRARMHSCGDLGVGHHHL